MKKTLLILVALVACLAVTVPALACQGPECVEETANSGAEGILAGTYITPAPSNSYAGGNSIADATLFSEAVASAKEYEIRTRVKTWHPPKRHWSHHRGWHTHRGYYSYDWVTTTMPGEAHAEAHAKMTQLGFVRVLTNGPQAGGLAYTYVKATALLIYDGSALATGSPGCPQDAIVTLSGTLTAEAWGNATSEGPYGGQGYAGGTGFTTISFQGQDSEFERHYNHTTAEASLKGILGVDQSLIAVTFVSEDGTYQSGFAAISTGGFFECGAHVNITAVNSSGMVSQGGYATNGQGAYAQGSSSASYNNVAQGAAVVYGTNKVTTTPNSITVESHQFASSYGSGGGGPQ